MDRHFTITSRRGILSFPGNSPLTIGQMEGCDVLIRNHSQYEDVAFAKILPNKNNDGWHIVKVSHYYPILINGNELNRVHYLNDGDVIEIKGHQFKFNIREGEQTAPNITHIHKTGKAVWGIIAAICIILTYVGYQLYDNQKERITDAMKSEIMASIFTTRVDSLQLIYCDSVVDTYTYAYSPVGTAFLTTGSLIVTARHCIQPWLNMVLPHEYANIPAMTEWPIEKALFAETENQLSGEANWRIVSYITLTDEEGNSLSISSEDFRMKYDSDDIVELGSYDEPKYWRSISHRYSRRDMMLGDIAVAKSDKVGNIAVVDKSELRKLLNHRGVKLTFVGHPESSVNGSLLDFKSDELRLPLEEMTECQGRIFLLAHEGGLTPGFSGGPVIVRDGSGFKAVGVVSVVDERNGNRSYSVPTSEIELIEK